MQKHPRPSFRAKVENFNPAILADAPDWLVVPEVCAAACIGLEPQNLRAMRRRGEVEYVQISAHRFGYTVGFLRQLIADRTIRRAAA